MVPASGVQARECCSNLPGGPQQRSMHANRRGRRTNATYILFRAVAAITTRRFHFTAIVTGGLVCPATCRVTGTVSPGATSGGTTAFT